MSFLINSAVALNENDKHPFGMLMPGRKYATSIPYRYGFNGQEKSTEIGGQGNSYAAEYWQYDSRLGRRWNRDPITKISESTYSTFGNNPIILSDPNGADTIDIKKTTTRVHLAGKSDGYSDGFVIPSRVLVTQSGEINIKEAKGDNIFRITDVTVDVFDNGNQTSSSKTTTLELNVFNSVYGIVGGQKMKGYIDDRYALAAHVPTWLLKYYNNKAPDIGIQAAIAYQKDVRFAAGLNKVMNIAYMISGVYGLAKTSLSRAVVEAFPSGFVTSQIEGFYMRSASSMTNGVYKKTIQTLAYMGEDGAGSMLKVVRSVEAEARAAGAKSLEIHGIEVVNPKILTTAKAAAEKFGYTFEQVTTNSIKLAKQLK
jgi:RHS repeat-associated protein